MLNAANVKKLMQEHQTEVSRLKETEASLRDEIDSLKQKIASLESDVSHLEGKIRIKDEEVTLMKDRVAEAKRTMDKCVADHKILTQTIEQ